MKGSAQNIYLTFDDGPVPGPTEFVLDTLRDFNARATFFCIGSNVVNNPGLYQRILSEGHATGNHTFTHPNGWKSDINYYVENIEQAAIHIHSDLFRPPYGRIKKKQADLVLQKYQVVMWDVLSFDYLTSVSPQQCYSNVIKYTRNGSIVVFHDSVKAFRNVEKVLPRYLKFLIDQGYKFATL